MIAGTPIPGPPETICHWPEVGEGWVCQSVNRDPWSVPAVGMYVLVCLGIIACAGCIIRRDMVVAVWDWFISAFKDPRANERPDKVPLE